MKNNENQKNLDENNQGFNNNDQMEKDDIINPEQFQVSRSAENTDKQDDSEYAPEENQFADGKGTQLAEEMDAADPEDFDQIESEELDNELPEDAQDDNH